MDIVKRGKNGDAKKARVLIEFDRTEDPLEYAILHKAQEESISIAASLTPDVKKLVYLLGAELGMPEAKAKLNEQKPKSK